MAEGLKKGDEIKCRECDEVILVVIEDIEPMAPLESRKLHYADETPVPYGAEMICKHCGVRFLSISTADRRTI